MRYAVIYSSRTGNTRSVAQAVLRAMPCGTVIHAVEDAPEPSAFDFLALGFWVDRARPDPAMWAYMEKVQGKTVALFGTMAAWPDSPHAESVRKHARERLKGNTVLGDFLCLGSLPKKRLDACFGPDYQNDKHPMDPERRERLAEGASHPDNRDFRQAAEAFRGFLAQYEEQNHAEKNSED